MKRYYLRYGRLRKVRVGTGPDSWHPRRGTVCLVQEAEHLWPGEVLYECREGRALLDSDPLSILPPTPEQAQVISDSGQKDQELVERLTELAKSLNLAMDIFQAEASLDGGLIRVYYRCLDASSLGAINEAWRDQGEEVRLEWHQVGARVKAKLCGGIAVCGREYCCSTVLRDLTPVTMRMARAEARSLQPDETAGACGRLKCCLRYEFENLDELMGPGARVRSRRITGQIVAVAEPGRSLWVENEKGFRLEIFLKEILEVDGQATGQGS